ncbi:MULTISPECIES: aldehyde dehydrogenase family protein [Bradyrhizobium]|uniref:Aldehyde dehydrogenase family protein n=1 Tax=Bradyrhizobium frederickii TaxID=2560054 RepID=A0A4Y9NMD3_9BRAD|nr:MULTISPECIES: aldehyde dehydrogenase family protein [Bradyrhizobium]RTE88376.1 aldehyde dehydrogenase family protein [Bradyrhizobium sp. LVM 105]TFV30465.1 aldehyde dehydrogenase family protein [Bradyrhizobium frederickii]TFV68914.1 aldehyde dehydrogenase family protein [Bradyrhizobium frederickii]
MSKHFIGGKWVGASNGETTDMIDPSTGKAYGKIAAGTREDVDLAVKAARSAFETGAWGKLTAAERGRILIAISQRILEKKEELAAIEARDTGKPMTVARNDINAVARYFEYYGGATDKVYGHTIPYLNDHFVAVVREPKGVTGHILPWNYPAQMFGRTLAPSLAVGNATVLKPAEAASASILRLAELATEAGLPDGAINIVTGFGSKVGVALTTHPGVNFVSFTGSPEVGQQIQKLAADNYINCTLELGGKSPQLVFEDADFEAATRTICAAIIQNSGQTCSAGSRVLVQRRIFDDFIATLSERFKAVRVGSPEMDLDCGPIITAGQKKTVLGFVDRATTSGLPLLAEGQIAEGVDPGGFFVRPALFGPVPTDHELAQQEVFGPVLAAIPFDDEDDAVRIANGTEFGLVAAVWTRDGGRQMHLAKRLRSGQVFVNCYGAGAGIELPFGGTGKSGHGREKGLVAMDDYSNLKTVVIKHA